MLGKGAIVVEGLTEFHSLPVVARIMEEANPDLQPLDISGVVLFDAETESNMAKFGRFFKDLGLKTFSYYDYIQRKPDKKQELEDSFDVDFEHSYAGFEDLLVSEVNTDRQWDFLNDLRDDIGPRGLSIPEERPDDEDMTKLVKTALKSNKGSGWAARLLEECSVDELPDSITKFLSVVYASFPKKTDDPNLEQNTDPEVSFL